MTRGGDPSGRLVHGSPSEVVGKLMSDRRVRVAWEAGEKLRKRVGRGKEKGNMGEGDSGAGARRDGRGGVEGWEWVEGGRGGGAGGAGQ